MSVYLGELGRLVELKCPSSQSVSVDDGTTFETTLEGRVKAQVRTARPRSWSVDMGAATPAELASMLAFAGGEWGHGPFVWVSTDAPVTNLMSPDASTCGPATEAATAASPGGPLALGGGVVAGRSLAPAYPSSRTVIGSERVPVLLGQRVTAGVWAVGNGAKLRLSFLDQAGVVVHAVESPLSGVAGSARRLHATTTAPSGATYCTLSVQFASQFARPSVTWTDGLFDWQPGEGCAKAVLHGLSKSVLLALRDPNYGRHSNASFTITEVG